MVYTHKRCSSTNNTLPMSLNTTRRSVNKAAVARHRDRLTSQVVYSKQPKLGLTQEFVVDCALWVLHSIKRLISLMLLKWFYLIVLFILCIGCLTKMFNRLVMCMDAVAALPHAHIETLHTHTMNKFTLSTVF